MWGSPTPAGMGGLHTPVLNGSLRSAVKARQATCHAVHHLLTPSSPDAFAWCQRNCLYLDKATCFIAILYFFATFQASRVIRSEAIVALNFCLMKSLIVCLMSSECKKVYIKLCIYSVFTNFTCCDRNVWFSYTKQLQQPSVSITVVLRAHD